MAFSIDPGYIFWVYRIFRVIFIFLDNILDKITGYSVIYGWKSEREENKDKAHLVKIIFRSAYHWSSWITLKNFLFIHEEYIDPEIIFEHDYITLHGMDEEHVWFCVTDPKDDVTDMSISPFAYNQQFLKAKKFLILTYEQTIKLAKVQEEKGYCHEWELIAMNSARCGSTLLCQMMHQLPNTKVVSEPWALVYAHKLINLGMHPGKEVIKAVTKLEMKKVKGSTNKRMMIKPPMMCCPLTEIIAEMLPNTYQMFMTRHPRDSNASFLKVWEFYDGDLYAKYDSRPFWFSCLSVPYTEYFRNVYRKYFEESKKEFASHKKCVALSYSGCVASYDLYRKHMSHVLIYERLVENPMREFEAMNEKLGMSFSTADLERALDGLRKDSQLEMFNKAAKKTTKMHSHTMDEKFFNDIFHEFRLPLTLNMDYEDFERYIQGE